MAEIKIEKKMQAWPWILAIILLIATLVYFFEFRNSDYEDTVATLAADTVATLAMDTVATNTPASPEMSSNDGAVNDFIQYVHAGHTMSLDHEYTNGALIRLANAIAYKAHEIGCFLTADLDQAEAHAEHITDDPYETTHATSIRNAANLLSHAMREMQQDKYPDLESEMLEVTMAANDINPKVLTLNQREAVKNFFHKSARLLQGMN